MPVAPYLQPFTRRSIIPNTTTAYVLRVDPWHVQRISIIGWKIEWFRLSANRAIDAPPHEKQPREFAWTTPLLAIGELDEISNARDLVVDHGVWSDGITEWHSEAEAIDAYRKELAER